MRFIKRIIFVLILLLIAFFVYRLINPIAANNLLYDLKSFSNTKVGTHFSLTTIPLITSGSKLVTTGALGDSGNLEGITDEELLLNDMDLTTTGAAISSSFPSSGTSSSGIISKTTVVSTSGSSANIIKKTPCPGMPTVNSCPTGQEKYVSYSSSDCGTYYACRTKITTVPKTTSTKGASSQAISDLKALFGD